MPRRCRWELCRTPSEVCEVGDSPRHLRQSLPPRAFALAWLTSDVVSLAKGIYDERAFNGMPILADALQDAGCDNDDVLNHCRDRKQVTSAGAGSWTWCWARSRLRCE